MKVPQGMSGCFFLFMDISQYLEQPLACVSHSFIHSFTHSQILTVCLQCHQALSGHPNTLFIHILCLYFLSLTWPMAHGCPNPLASVHPAWPSQSARLPAPAGALLFAVAGMTIRAGEPLLWHDPRGASPDCFPLLFEAEFFEARVSGMAHF